MHLSLMPAAAHSTVKYSHGNTDDHARAARQDTSYSHRESPTGSHTAHRIPDDGGKLRETGNERFEFAREHLEPNEARRTEPALDDNYEKSLKRHDSYSSIPAAMPLSYKPPFGTVDYDHPAASMEDPYSEKPDKDDDDLDYFDKDLDKEPSEDYENAASYDSPQDADDDGDYRDDDEVDDDVDEDDDSSESKVERQLVPSNQPEPREPMHGHQITDEESADKEAESDNYHKEMERRANLDMEQREFLSVPY